MWGNTLGWMISAVLTAVVVGALYFLLTLSQTTPRTELSQNPENLAVVAIPYDLDKAWPNLWTQDGDAGPIYQKIIDGWDLTAQQACDTFQQGKCKGELPEVLKELIAARPLNRMRLFVNDLPSLINYDSAHPRLDTLDEIGSRADQLGLALDKFNRHDEARAVFGALFSLGRHLYTERVIFEEYQQGVKRMAEASTGMLPMESQGSPLFESLTEFDEKRALYGNHIRSIMERISGQRDQTNGDMLVLARDAKEPMWRVEATLKLGRFKFNAAAGDQTAAAQLVARLVNDPDPAVATAAAAARDLTIEKYRMIH